MAEGKKADIMDVDKKEDRTGELKLHQPSEFTGKKDDLKYFLQKVRMYLLINKRNYDDDEKKILYALFFFKEGTEAGAWSSEFIADAKKKDPIDLGTWNDFITSLKEAFEPYDAPADAFESLKTLRMGDKTADEHNAVFKTLLTQSKIPKDTSTTIDLYRESLTIPPQRRIMTLDNPPETLDNWYKWSAKLDHNFRKMQRVVGKARDNNNNKNSNSKGNAKYEPKRTWNFQRKEKDPNAMDVDALTLEKRNEMMKKGLCFGCGEQGHLSRDCPKKKKPSTYQTPSQTSSITPPSYSKKPPPKELAAYIRAITAEYNDDEKNNFYDDVEQEGF
jgi:Ty3 transposon capsid-like protein/Zinc knuckle